MSYDTSKEVPLSYKPKSTERRVWRGGTIMRPVDPRTLSTEAQHLLVETACPPISRNSSCPCGSGKRFKRCHGAPQ